MARILVFGASGLLGREIYRVLKEENTFDVIGTCNSRKSDSLIPFSYSQPSQVHQILEEVKPTITINCIAIRQPDVVEKDLTTTHRLNVEFPTVLAQECNERSILLIHFSSDYVFDGTKSPYHPSDPCCPINKYGESKWEAEKVVSSHCKNSLIIRIPVLYGPGDFSESSILSLYNQLIQKKECYIDHIAKRVPTLTTDIAITIHAFIYSRSTIRGIVHISSNKEFTKFEIIHLMAQYLNLSTDHIKPLTEDRNVAKRPYNCHLDCSELVNAGLLTARDFDEGLIEVFLKAGLL